MSQPFSRIIHPFDVAHFPRLEPEVERATLASWASERSATTGRTDFTPPPDRSAPATLTGRHVQP